VSYRKAKGSPHSGYKIFNASTFQGVIDGLQPFTVYFINVRASTIKGQGPSSAAIHATTEEEGWYKTI